MLDMHTYKQKQKKYNMTGSGIITIYVNKEGLFSISNGKKPASFQYSPSASYPISVQITISVFNQWNLSERGDANTNNNTNKKLLFD